MAIRVVLADDHPVVLGGLARLFALEPDFEVVACTNDGAQTMEAVLKLRPDVVVLDLRMPGKDGLAVVRELRRESSDTQIVVFTAVEGPEVVEAIRLGVRGLVLKDMAVRLLFDAVRKVHAGGTWIERDAAGVALQRFLRRDTDPHDRFNTLTPREKEVALMTEQGLPNKTIADRLSITEGTAKLHLHHVYAKLGVDGRIALVRYLQRVALDKDVD